MTFTREEKIKLCRAMWNDAELVYEDDFHVFKHLPLYFSEPDPAQKTLQYKIRIVEDAISRKGLVRTPVSTMDWYSPSLAVDVVPLSVWKTIFDFICIDKP